MSLKQVTDLTLAIENLATATLAVSDAVKRLASWRKKQGYNNAKRKLMLRRRTWRTEKKAKVLSKQLADKNAELKQLEERLVVKGRELGDKEMRLKEIEERMNGHGEAVKKLYQNVAKLGPVVKLNVGTNYLLNLLSRTDSASPTSMQNFH
jgi:chromosome segregation ATPase